MLRRPLLKLLALLAVFGLIAAACGDDGDSNDANVVSGDTDDGGDDTGSDDTADDSGDDTGSDDTGDDGDTPPEQDWTTHNVPADYPTIQAAVDAAEPGDLVLIDAGVYHEAVVVQTDNIVIRGVDRNTVILDGEHADGMENGVIVFSNGVAVENLTVRNYTGNGLFWTGDYGSDILVDGYRASYVTAHNIGVYGMYAFNAVNGQIDHAYAGASDDSSFYIGQCNPCNALLYDVVGVNSQLGYSGTNSTGTIVANSEFYDNMIGVVPNSQDGEELAPNAGTTIIGNYIHDNNNTEVPSRNTGFQTGLGSGVVLTGTTNNIVERNLIVDNERAGVIVVDWIDAIFANGNGRDHLAADNIIRDNVIEGSTLEADLLMALYSNENGGNGNCFSGNTTGATTPADIETVLPCDGADTAELLTLLELLEKFNVGFDPVDYKDIPAPELNFETMPGDPLTDPPMPAIDVPMVLDLDAIQVPERP
ncbi:MAG: right-handed parallel beta-helix repeat-containing protein [Acidimicrobiales bacterium]|nr:right-handed parallel beta-helix repeat-containing protein [Acidimicrobiales bacterium]